MRRSRLILIVGVALLAYCNGGRMNAMAVRR